MDASSLIDFARFKPLAAWSLSSTALGASMAVFLSGGRIDDPWLMAAAVVCVVLMQYVAHPLNDITDLEADRRAAIAATGRRKPLVDGPVTVGEAKALSGALVGTILLLMAGLILVRPALIVPASYGMFALMGYNHSAMRLSYRPYAELYLAAPVNAIAVLVIAYIGSDAITPLSILVATAFGIAASSLFVSMMSMDYRTDKEAGKRTTVAKHPRWRWCEAFPALGLIPFLAAIPLAYSSMSYWGLVAYAALSTATFLAQAALVRRADRVRMEHIDRPGGRMEERSNDVRLKQLYISILYAVGLSAIFLQQGVWSHGP